MQTAEERYEYAWQDYQASQERGEYKSLKSYCQSHHIHYEGMRYWKRKNIGPSNTTRSMSKTEAYYRLHINHTIHLRLIGIRACRRTDFLSVRHDRTHRKSLRRSPASNSIRAERRWSMFSLTGQIRYHVYTRTCDMRNGIMSHF